MTDSDPTRLQQVELKLMEMEMTLHQLNEVVLTQYREIKQLEAAYAQLEKRLAQTSGAPTSETQSIPSIDDEVPPHY
ncbi:MAG: SlyX family protein [Granulosicoccaceae bacterium]